MPHYTVTLERTNPHGPVDQHNEQLYQGEFFVRNPVEALEHALGMIDEQHAGHLSEWDQSVIPGAPGVNCMVRRINDWTEYQITIEPVEPPDSWMETRKLEGKEFLR